ncbi:aldose epimerase family protein [Robertkochia solimangrovi]|uniref:aldose epimerase family protein n=1 Tax=Robertkochia solimangrovi TaxID=2213046 RepID=UPI00117DFA99|nr:aldose epimerase family protein [Robertkochia solimangrovi]TRZ42808.1 galactose mutarotase [Robertkochia solimangrovi]
METFTIKNKHLSISCLNYGAAMTSLIVKDKLGKEINVIYGFKDPKDYDHNTYYLGAAVGRIAGRIGGGGFTLNEVFYPLYNDNGVHLHGGTEGFSFRDWELEEITEGEQPEITLKRSSENMEDGYPGNLEVSVTYKLIDNKLSIRFTAESDQDTYVNFTNHNYYNLAGEGSILDQELYMDAASWQEKDEKNLATGKLLDVTNTPFDFRSPRNVGSHPDFKGIDDCFSLGDEEVSAGLYSPESGIEMKVYTNQAAVVVFTPETIDKKEYLNPDPGTYPAICFETQGFNNAPNKPEFPSILLKKGERYINESVYEFNIR